MTASPHPPDVAEWMGMDATIEGILLATAAAGATPAESGGHRAELTLPRS
jgi:hypothetical protein